VSRPKSYFVTAAALLAAGLVLGLGLSAGLELNHPSSAARGGLPVVNSGPAPESPFVQVVDRALPAVVFIDVRRKLASGGDGEAGPYDDMFRRFFGDPQRRPQRVPSSGSGFIVDPEGYVLTNNHVVRDADDITVTLSDKRTFKAKVVGSDRATDVAVIKVEARNLPALPIGDSDKIRVGDWVVAIGNPLGELEGTVTAGIVSAKGRTNLNIFGGTPDYQDFIQTDASINFGNSGGPLCNIRGEVIGINTAINPGGQGIGFAIPINLARHVADQLIAHGAVQRAWLGVTLDAVTADLAEGLSLPNTDGVLVNNVMDGTPAERAGIRRGDVIIEFDGQKVTDMQKFRMRVADTPVNKRVPVTILRNGRRMDLSVTLGERPEQVVAEAQRGTQPEVDQYGLSVRDLTPEERRASGVESGVMVTEVGEGSVAEEAGIQPNDVIEEVGGKPVANARALRTALTGAASGGKSAVLLVNSGGNSRFVVLKAKR
jgi:Do/DeqQ family serine protease